jgi:hypothetical protein
MRRLHAAAVLGLLIGLIAVGGCALFSDSISGRVVLRLTDAPLQADAINVSLLGLELIDTASGDRESIDLGSRARDINLLEFQGGSSLTVTDHPVSIEQFDHLRLVVANQGSIVVGGNTYDLRIPSGMSSGVKFFLREPVVLGGGVFDIMIDFDAYESVVPRGPRGNPTGYVLQPVIRPLSASLNDHELPLSLLPVVDDPGDQLGTVGDEVALMVRAVDPDRDPMAFSADGLPPGLTMDGESGEISGVLSAEGTYAVTVTVSDHDGASSVAFGWFVSPPAASGHLESVIVSGVASDRWTSVALLNEYQSMVTVCTLHYINNAAPVVIRIRNTELSSFDVRIQNPRGALLARETVHCLVAEEGAWQLPDGRSVEARTYMSTFTDENDYWMGERQSYLVPFARPVVLGQVMSYNDPDWSVFWSRGATTGDPPSSDHLWTGKHSGEDLEAGRFDEKIGYIVFEAGMGHIEGTDYRVALGPNAIGGMSDGPPFVYSFDAPLGGIPAFGVATMSGMDGLDGGWVVLYRNAAFMSSGLQLAIDEDRTRDSERSHPMEQVAYAVFSGPANVLLTVHPANGP